MGYLNRYLFRMGLFLSLVLGAGVFLREALWSAFKNNIILNSFIVSVLFLGICLVLHHLFRLRKEQKWLDSCDQDEEKRATLNSTNIKPPKILAPLGIIFSGQGGTQPPPTMAIRSVLNGVESRLDESRDVARYLIGLLIFLGLLGTFWGLSQTIGAITGVITGMDVGAKEAKDAFQILKQGLQSPLSGMGTAFSSSLFGLVGSLILGFLDLQYLKATGAFFHHVEDKVVLSKKYYGAESGGSAYGGPAYTQSLLEHAAENMGQLQVLMRRNEDNRASVVKALQTLGEKLSLLTEQTLAQQSLLRKVAQNHIDLQDSVTKLTVTLATTQGGVDEGIRQYLRNLDTTTLKLLEETVEGRNRTIQDLRTDIRLVARTISALANENVAA